MPSYSALASASLADTPQAREASDLDARFGRPGAVAFRASALGGVVAELTAADGARAMVALKGAHVLGFSLPDFGDVLWLSPVARLDAVKPARGGIPVCWPWFGPHASDAGRPAHGFARTSTWTVLATQHGHDGTALIRLGLRGADIADRTVAAGYADLTATLDVTLGTTLRVTLTSRNHGSHPVAITGALHSYFAIGDIAVTTVDGLAGRPYIDQLDGGTLKREAGPVRFEGELDRIYQDTAGTAATIVDAARALRIVIANSGSRATVVWNPGPGKAARLGDLGPDGWRRMLCVESANAGADVVLLEPGAEHALATEISVQAL